MDKTNLNTPKANTNTSNAQPQPNNSAPAGQNRNSAGSSASLARQAPHLEGATASAPRAVQTAPDKKLNFYCQILKGLFEKINTDPSALGRLLYLLNKKDVNTQETLLDQFVKCNHSEGIKLAASVVFWLPEFCKEWQHKNFQDLDTRQTCLDGLSLRVHETFAFSAAYETNVKKDIEFQENIFHGILSSPVSLKDSQTSIGVMQLAQVLHPQSIEGMQQHLFRYCEVVEAGDVRKTSSKQFALYFVYAFLGKNLDVLGRLFSCLQDCPEPFKNEAEGTIASYFRHFLNDLSEPYIDDYGLKANDYDSIIAYVCNAYPKLVDACFECLFRHACSNLSLEFLKDIIAVRNSQNQCFLDMAYSRVRNSEGYISGMVLLMLSKIEQFLLDDPARCKAVSPVVLALDLPHLIQYLSTVSTNDIRGFNKDAGSKLFHYLLLSLLSKDIHCIQRFKEAEARQPDKIAGFFRVLEELASHCFEINGPIQSSEEDAIASRELFFEILEALKKWNLLTDLNLMVKILYVCLTKDRASGHADDATPRFHRMLKGLQAIGFDLNYREPQNGTDILQATYLLNKGSRDTSLFRKLINLGCNPYFIYQGKSSFYKQLTSYHQGGDQAAAPFIKALGAMDNKFMSFSFVSNILKDKGLEERDEKQRTPLMFYVMINMDVAEIFGRNLEAIQLRDLEAKDKEEWTVVDYAKHNNDTKTLDLLNARKEALQKQQALEAKSKKPSLFRQAAALAGKLATQKAPDASNTPSKSSQRRQARKLRDKTTANTSPSASTPEITIDYNAATGTSTTRMKDVRAQSAKASAKEKAKADAKQKKKEDKLHTPTQEKAGLWDKAKKKMKTVAATLETARTLAQHPQGFVQALASKLSQTKAGERLASRQKPSAVSKEKPFAMLEDGLWLSNGITLTGLAQEAIGKQQLGILPSVIKTLDAMDEAIASNPRLKIDRTRILEALQWAVGGKVEYGKGSHLNLRYAGGVFTIPQNKDGSDNADIVYIKKAADLLAQQLRALLLGYELTQGSITSEDSSAMEDTTFFDSNSETSNSEEVKNETPEPSSSE